MNYRDYIDDVPGAPALVVTDRGNTPPEDYVAWFRRPSVEHPPVNPFPKGVARFYPSYYSAPGEQLFNVRYWWKVLLVSGIGALAEPAVFVWVPLLWALGFAYPPLYQLAVIPWHRSRHYDRARRAWYVYNQILHEWTTSRPLYRIQHADDPLETGRTILRNEYEGTIFLGIDQTTERLVTAKRNASTFVVGPTGEGKTLAVNVPTLLLHRGAAVATSTKLDIIQDTAQTRRTLGRTWIFDPSGKSYANLPDGISIARWTPLQHAETWDSAVMTAALMLEATALGRARGNNAEFWNSQAELLLAPMLFAGAVHQDTTIVDVANWIKHQDFTTAAGILESVIAKDSHPRRSGALIARDNLKSTRLGRSELVKDVFVTARAMLKVYDLESARESIEKGPNFDPYAFARSSETLYITVPSKYQKMVAPLIVGVIDQIVLMATERNSEKGEAFRTSTRSPVLLALDEVGNIAPLHDLPNYLSEGAGQGIQVLASMQTMAQAKGPWSDYWDSFADLFRVSACFGGLGLNEFTRLFSTASGDEYQQYISHTSGTSSSSSTGSSSGVSEEMGLLGKGSRSFGTNTSTTYGTSQGTTSSVQKQAVMSPGDIATITTGKIYVRSRDTGSGMALVRPNYREPWITLVANLPADVDFGEPPVLPGPPYPILPPLEAIKREAEAAEDKARTSRAVAARQRAAEENQRRRALDAVDGFGTPDTPDPTLRRSLDT